MVAWSIKWFRLGPRRIGFYRNRISTGKQNHHSVSGSPEPDFLKIRFRSGRTGFQNLTGFRPDFKIPPDYYRNSKFCRKITGIYNFAGFLLKFYKVMLSNHIRFSLNKSTNIMSTKFRGLRGQIKVLTMLITWGRQGVGCFLICWSHFEYF